MSAEAFTVSLTTDAGSALHTFALPKHKLDATTAPTVSDDDTAGYIAGSVWMDKTNDKGYLCTDNGTGAAVWVQIAGTGAGGGAPADADYLVKTAHTDLSAERVVTDTATIAWDWGTSGQAKASVVIDTDGTLAANSDTKIASQKAIKTYVDNAVTGLFDFKGSTDASANPNYPSALKGDAYVITVAGKIGGGSGKSVDIGDLYLAIADNAGGTEGSVGTSWVVLEHNLVGAMVGSNNLNEITSQSTARSNLGLGSLATQSTVTEAMQTLADNTTGNASTSMHGYLKKLDNTATHYMDGQGNWTVPPSTLDINGLSAADPAFNDTLAAYDTSATANRKMTVERLLGLVKVEPGGRLTLTTGVPITLTGVTGSTIYYTPFVNNWLTLWDGTRWLPHYFDEFAIAAPAGSALDNFDVFAFASTNTPSSTNTGTDIITFSGATGWATGAMVTVSATGGGLTAGTTYWWNAASSTTGSLHATLANALAGSSKVDLTASITAELTAISLETLIWTNNTTRATAVTYQDGILCKSGDKTRLYLGSISLTSSAVVDDTDALRNLWNQYNRAVRKLKKAETTASWTYATNSWRALNNASTNAVVALLGDPACRTFVSLTMLAGVESGSAARAGYVGIGQNASTQNDADATSPGAVAGNVPASSVLIAIPSSVGRTTWYATEYAGGGTSTFYGVSAQIKTALTGWYLG